jgi:hypothetical protein
MVVTDFRIDRQFTGLELRGLAKVVKGDADRGSSSVWSPHAGAHGHSQVSLPRGVTGDTKISTLVICVSHSSA